MNDLGLNAYAIDNAINNTLKADLVNATRFSVVNTLNSTFPKVNSLSTGFTESNIFMSRLHQNAHHKNGENTEKAPRRSMLRNRSGGGGGGIVIDNTNDSHLKRSDLNRRRLVYFTENLPIRVDWLADNPFCPSNSSSNCVLLKFDICIVLETGDIALDIRKKIIGDLPSGIVKYLVGY